MTPLSHLSPLIYAVNEDTPSAYNAVLHGHLRDPFSISTSNKEDTNNGKGYLFLDPDFGMPLSFQTASQYLAFQRLTKEGKEKFIENHRRGLNPPNQVERAVADLIAGNPTYSAFNNENDWRKHEKDVQMQINATKYQQSEAFRHMIHESIRLGERLGGGPITIWTSTDQNSTNQLGDTQTAFARFVKENGPIQNGIDQNKPPRLMDCQRRNLDNFFIEAKSQSYSIQQNMRTFKTQSISAGQFNPLPSSHPYSSSNQSHPQPATQMYRQTIQTLQVPTNTWVFNNSDPGKATRMGRTDSQGGIIEAYYRNDPKDPWKRTSPQQLLAHGRTPLQTLSHEWQYNQNETKMAKVVNGHVTEGYFRRNEASPWEKSGDLKQFADFNRPSHAMSPRR